MPLYLIERNFPEPVEEGSQEELNELKLMNEKYDLQWIYSFADSTRKCNFGLC